MTHFTGSFLDIIAAEDSDNVRLARKAVTLSKLRTDNQFGSFIEAHGPTALSYLEEEMSAVITAACEEVGYDDVDAVKETVVASYRERAQPEARTASVHESRKPKMCPFHRDVVDISLTQGEARAGFDAMAQHWGGPRHCDGEGYEGGKCNFKAPMVTQAFWDEKAEKAEERKQQRQEQAEQELQTEQPEVELESPVEDAAPAEEIITDDLDNVIDFPVPEYSEPSAIGEGIDTTPEPLAVAASTKTADGVCECGHPASVHDGEAGCESCEDEGKDFNHLFKAKTAKTAGEDELGGKGTPEPKIDKAKWTPQNVKELPLEGDESRHPTKRVDIVDVITADNLSELSEIGENKTERVDVTKDQEQISQPDGSTWTEGPKTAVSSRDPEKNELVEIMRTNFDGFLPQADVQQIVVSHKSR